MPFKMQRGLVWTARGFATQHRGQNLVFGDDDPAVFVYTPTKEGHHALDFFTLGTDTEGQPIRWKGTITADVLSLHDCLFADGSRTEAGCNAHGLRKFRDDVDKASEIGSIKHPESLLQAPSDRNSALHNASA